MFLLYFLIFIFKILGENPEKGSSLDVCMHVFVNKTKCNYCFGEGLISTVLFDFLGVFFIFFLVFWNHCYWNLECCCD